VGARHRNVSRELSYIDATVDSGMPSVKRFATPDCRHE